MVNSASEETVPMTDVYGHRMDEVCVYCGCSYGSHLGGAYRSERYGKWFPRNYCPGHEGRMDWNEGPGTVFEWSGKYLKDVKRAEDGYGDRS